MTCPSQIAWLTAPLPRFFKRLVTFMEPFSVSPNRTDHFLQVQV
jgi:hypothetical protein